MEICVGLPVFLNIKEKLSNNWTQLERQVKSLRKYITDPISTLYETYLYTCILQNEV